jgi:hypothetical protein
LRARQVIAILFSFAVLPSAISATGESARSAAIERAVAMVATKAGVDPRRVEQLGAEAVDWPDSSLGCPQPGMQYLQSIHPGYRVRLRVGEALYEVHVSDEQAVVCAENPQKITKPPSRIPAAVIAQLSRDARIQLAGKLRVRRDLVQVLHVAPLPVSGAAPACPGADYVITLQVRGRQYTYQANAADRRLCEPQAP